VGYSGWSPNQLRNELKSKSWFVTSVSAKTIMRTDIEDLWGTILKSMGKKYKMIANLPSDPSQN
jgi:putative transcriptional regulator